MDENKEFLLLLGNGKMINVQDISQIYSREALGAKFFDPQSSDADGSANTGEVTNDSVYDHYKVINACRDASSRKRTQPKCVILTRQGEAILLPTSMASVLKRLKNAGLILGSSGKK